MGPRREGADEHHNQDHGENHEKHGVPLYFSLLGLRLLDQPIICEQNEKQKSREPITRSKSIT
jgi:hypothetical protein